MGSACYRVGRAAATRPRVVLPLACAVLLAACSGLPRPPVLPELAAAPARPVVVLVPGVTGVELVEAATGRLLWGRGVDLFVPRDGGYATAVPLAAGPEQPDGGVVPGAVIEEVRLLHFIRKPVYGEIVRLLEANGYRRGDLERPAADRDLYLFAYDWRRDNVEAAALLGRRLEALSRVRGEERLPVALMCQSNGAHVCRYFAKYGGADLEAAERGAAAPPATVEVVKMILVGTSNGGGLRILREMNRGRRYVPGIGRRWRPETLFTFAALYQDLPVYRDDLFVDETGRPLPVDLFDAESWRLYGWSVYGRRPARRLARGRRPELFADPGARAAHLARMLDRAARFHRLLRRDVAGFGCPGYYLIQNVYDPTPERAVLARRGDGWRTLFTGDRALVRRPGLLAAASAGGDGHATRESQLWLSPQELAALVADPFYLKGEHFEMILDPATHRRLLDFLAAPEAAAAEGCG